MWPIKQIKSQFCCGPKHRCGCSCAQLLGQFDYYERKKEKKKIDQLKKEKRGGRNKAVSYNNTTRLKDSTFFSILPRQSHHCHSASKSPFSILFTSSFFWSPSLPPTLSLTSSLVARAGPAQHIRKRSCSDNSVSPNLAIMNRSATVPSCGFARYNTNQT